MLAGGDAVLMQAAIAEREGARGPDLHGHKTRNNVLKVLNN
jgi:hypothetical protein